MVAPSRQRCGNCTSCCKLLAVREIAKPPGALCAHCKEGQGCSIYEKRPVTCQQFHCYFLTNYALREYWRPSKSHMVLIASPDGMRIGAHVDPARPGAWRREPYYSTLKHWARAAVSKPGLIGQVFVTVGNQTIVVLPDRDVHVGAVDEDELVITEGRPGPQGVKLEVFKIKRSDPRAVGIAGAIATSAQGASLFQ